MQLLHENVWWWKWTNRNVAEKTSAKHQCRNMRIPTEHLAVDLAISESEDRWLKNNENLRIPRETLKDAEGRAQRNVSLQNSHERWTAQHFGRCVPRWPYAIQAPCAKTLCDFSCTCLELRSTSQYICIQESLVRCSTFQDGKNTHAAEVEISDTSDTLPLSVWSTSGSIRRSQILCAAEL